MERSLVDSDSEVAQIMVSITQRLLWVWHTDKTTGEGNPAPA